MRVYGFGLGDIFQAHKSVVLEFLPVQQIFLYFISYSFIGWVCECVYVGAHERRPVNRGFLRGPLCPIYGCGGILLNMLPQQIRESYLPLFFCTMLVCSAVEYVTSWYLERTFHTRWWDYSQKKFNLNGRVCLLNSVLFGLLGIFVLHFVQPFIHWAVCSLSALATALTANVIGIVFVADLVTTVKRLVDFKSLLEKIEELNERLHDQFGSEVWLPAQSLSQKFEAARLHLRQAESESHRRLARRLEDLMQRQKRHSLLLRNFPTATSESHKASLAMMRGSESQGGQAD